MLYILSAYHAQSHKYWVQRIQKYVPENILFELSPRYFNWRFQGNALIFQDLLKDTLVGSRDCILATSMVNLATLVGLKSQMADAHLCLYFHENQFQYPINNNIQGSVERKLTSLYSALAAHSIAFNSHYNKSSFLEGLELFLKKLPEKIPGDPVTTIENKSQVIPVPIRRAQKVLPDWKTNSTKLRIVWNHRWEYDKDPEALYWIVKGLHDANFEFSISILGQRFRESPEGFSRILSEFPQRISAFGFIEDHQEYQSHLKTADIVLSTANHEFQGLALQEAVCLGLLPIAPSGLAYEEYLPKCYIYQNHTDPRKKSQNAIQLIEGIARSRIQRKPIDLVGYGEDKLRNQYLKWLRIDD